jgi:hypothetical protein
VRLQRRVNKQERRHVAGSDEAYRYEYAYTGYYGDGDDDGAGAGQAPRSRRPARPGLVPGWLAKLRSAMASLLS